MRGGKAFHPEVGQVVDCRHFLCLDETRRSEVESIPDHHDIRREARDLLPQRFHVPALDSRTLESRPKAVLAESRVAPGSPQPQRPHNVRLVVSDIESAPVTGHHANIVAAPAKPFGDVAAGLFVTTDRGWRIEVRDRKDVHPDPRPSGLNRLTRSSAASSTPRATRRSSSPRMPSARTSTIASTPPNRRATISSSSVLTIPAARRA